MRAAVLVLAMALPACSIIEEPDDKPEHAAWPKHCTADGVFLSPGATPADIGGDGLTQWWAQRSDGYVLLRSDCTTVAVELPKPRATGPASVEFTLNLYFATAGGSALLQKVESPSAATSLWYLPRPGAALQKLENVGDPSTRLLLSKTGDALAWLEYLPYDGQGPRYRLRVKPLSGEASAQPLAVDLPGRSESYLLAFDSATRESLLWRDDRPVLASLDGSLRDAPYAAGQVSPLNSTYRIHPRGWMAWDGYRGTDSYRLAWSVSGHSGQVRTNKGRSVTSAAVDPGGRFIAMSESTTLRIGNARDLLRVFRTADASEALRLYLPRHSRPEVLFFAGGRFAYTDRSGTHILRIAE